MDKIPKQSYMISHEVVCVLHPVVKLRGQTSPIKYTRELESIHGEHSKYPDHVAKDILNHHVNEDKGELVFWTLCEGLKKDWITWERVTSFIGDVTKKWSECCRQNEIDVDLTTELPIETGRRQLRVAGQQATFPGNFGPCRQEVQQLQVLHKQELCENWEWCHQGN